MERSYTYFKNLLHECLESVDQLKIKSELISGLKDATENKVTSLQGQISEIRKSFFLENKETIIDKLNHIKFLQTSLNEQEAIVKSLRFTVNSLNLEISNYKKQRDNYKDNYSDDLPF